MEVFCQECYIVKMLWLTTYYGLVQFHTSLTLSLYLCKRKYILFVFFQSDVALSPPWQSEEVVDVLLEWMIILAGVLGMLNYFFIECSEAERCALAPSIWDDLFNRISTPLGLSGERVAGIAERCGVSLFAHTSPQRPANYQSPRRDTSPPICRVCLDRTPTIMVRSCGHVFCHICVHRVYRCPVCRATILGRQRIFY